MTTKESTYGEILDERQMAIIITSLINVMEDVNQFSGGVRVRRAVRAIVNTSDEIMKTNRHYGELMATAFLETFNSSEMAIRPGGKTYFDIPTEKELYDFIAESDIRIKWSGLNVYKVDHYGRKISDVPTYRYKFAIRDDDGECKVGKEWKNVRI